MSAPADPDPPPSVPEPALPPPVAVSLATLPPHACAYLPGRTTTLRAFYTGRLPGRLYHDFMDAGFRRSGRVVYQPVCQGCRACVPLRVPVAEFAPASRSAAAGSGTTTWPSRSTGPS